MKNLFSFLSVFLILCLNAYSQFKEAHGGYAFATTAVISRVGYESAGGGVILKGESKAVLADASVVFLSALMDDANGLSNIKFKTSKCDVTLSGSSWLMSDAAMLVNGEMGSKLHKEVDLLTKPIPEEMDFIAYYPPSRYFYVEVNRELIGTKSGEMLLLVDLLLTDVNFYSDKTSIKEDNVYRYRRARDSLGRLSFPPNFPSDWTYNDEDTRYTFNCSCDKHKLVLKGAPNFTFLDIPAPIKRPLYFRYLRDMTISQPQLEINYTFTNYFFQYPHLITNLKKGTMTNAIKFGQVASFFRYLKKNNASLWQQIVKHYRNVPSKGVTPRIIKR